MVWYAQWQAHRAAQEAARAASTQTFHRKGECLMRYAEFEKEIGVFKLCSSGGSPSELHLKIALNDTVSGYQLTIEQVHDLRYALDRFLAAWEQHRKGE